MKRTNEGKCSWFKYYKLKNVHVVYLPYNTGTFFRHSILLSILNVYLFTICFTLAQKVWI